MAYVPKKLRLNRFKNVRCVTNEDIYKRVGPRSVSFSGSSSGGDDYSESINYSQSKLDSLQAMRAEDYRRYSEEMSERQRQAESAKQEKTQEATE